MHKQRARALRQATEGASLVEYIVAVGLVALLAMVAFRQFGGALFAKNGDLGNAVTTLTPLQGGPGAGGCTGGMCVPGFGNCFVAGTPVLTPSGEVAIESIHEGDLVLSRDPSGAFGAQRAGKTYERAAPSLVDLRIVRSGDTETLHVTPEHQIWTLDAGWRSAGALEPGEPLVDDRGDQVSVVSVTVIPAEAVVYNFEVEETHTYFVGTSHILVHNPYYPPGQQGPGQQQQPPQPAPYIPVNNNTGNTTENCYYASTAALAGQTCTQLEGNSGVPVPPGTAQAPQIAQFMNQVGVGTGTYTQFTDPNAANQQIQQAAQNAPEGQAFGIGYQRPDGTGHMVTGVVGPGHVLTYVDFQTNPPTVAQGIDGASVSGVVIFPTNINVHGNPAFDQLGTYHQNAPNGALR